MTIYLINYHYQQDTYNGWDWEHYFEDEFGYYTDEAKARAKADALNERDHRSAYNNYVTTETKKHDLAKKQAELLFRQNEVLRASGLDPFPGNESARFSTFTPIEFEDWIKTRYNREHYYEIFPIEAAKDE